MKKILLVSIVALLSVGFADAFFGRGNGCCPTQRRVRSCATPCAVETEPCPPKCYKTIMVPKTIQVAKCIEVPAQRIEIPRPDLIERIPQKPIEVRIPCPPIQQPDRIEYRCVPDVIRHIPQKPCVRFQCPSDCR